MKARGLAGDLLSLHPDGRAARQHPVRTRIPTTPPGRASPLFPWRGADHLFPGCGVRRNGGQDRHGGKARSRRVFRLGHSRPTSASRVSRFSWTGPSGDWGLRRMVLHYAHLLRGGGRRWDDLPDRYRDAGADDHPLGRGHLSGGAGVSGICSRMCGRFSGRGSRSAMPPTGRNTSVTSRVTARATCSSTSTRSGADPEIDFVGIDNYMPLVRTGATGFEHADPRSRAGPRSTTGAISKRTSRAAKASTGSMPARRIARRRCAPRSPTAPPASPGSSATRICAPGGRTRTTTVPLAWRAARRPRGRRSPSRSGSPSSAARPSTGAPTSPTSSSIRNRPRASRRISPRGWRDDAIQRAYLEATYLWWGTPANNPVVLGLRCPHGGICPNAPPGPGTRGPIRSFRR